MSEFPPSSVPGEALVASQVTMNEQAIESLLADFRSWLMQAAHAELPEPADEAAEPVDLATLVGQFVALRHEVNLQTRSSRAQQEQNTETLRQLSQALELLQNPPEANADADERERAELLRPLLKALIDVHDNLALARREVLRAQENLIPVLDQLASSAGSVPLPKETIAPVWLRWLGAGKAYTDASRAFQEAQEERARQSVDAIQRVRQFIASLVTGYTMSLQRLERTLGQYGLEPIPAIGRPFDPERMEVVEVVHEPGRTGNEVTDEVRRGYLWQGKVFRCAQVRVARS
ncbi:MAG TPA: nucleotide exchange factor GrpE [Gemmataceae bacterium]|nr:nucleotide exchange factor GrpE [Gemmataceae bacterium]